MPVNPGIEYQLAQEEYNKATTTLEKMRCLEKMYSTAPKHKSSEGLLQQIKTKLAKLRDKVEKERQQKKKGFAITVKREGAAQIMLLGIASSGKSTLLKKFTNAHPEIAPYGFTTTMPEMGIMEYFGMKLQIVEMPAITEGYADKGNGPAFMAIARNANLIVLVLDGTKPLGQQIKLIENECEKSFIKFGQQTSEERVHNIPTIITVTKKFRRPNTKYPVIKEDHLKEAIWKQLNMIYAFTKQPAKERDWPPVALKKGATVKDLAEIVHKDFVQKFKYARIWGKSAKHPGATIGLEHILKEGDIVEVHIK